VAAHPLARLSRTLGLVAETEAPLVELLEGVRPLARQLAVVLVCQELAELTTSLNGVTPEPVETTAATGVPSTKVCKTCGRELPLDRFAKHRNQCKSCRNRAYGRERRLAATHNTAPRDEEPPRTGGTGAET
jgi:hypothetical protein